MMADQEPLVLHRKDAAKMLGISLTSLDRAIAAGQLKVKKYGKRSLLTMAECKRFLDELPDQPKSKAKPRTPREKYNVRG
jgi:hypothetical protein